VSHLFFWLALVLPWTVGIFYPGPSTLDELVGLNPLSARFCGRLIIGGAVVAGSGYFLPAEEGRG
jgi:hypothetical protein